jgi:ribonuclease HII
MNTIGSDEAGYGAWAGDLFVCAYVAPAGWSVPGLGDSKVLSAKQREKVYAQLDLSRAVILTVNPATIDDVGVFRALIGAHTQAIQILQSRGFLSARVVVDGTLRLPLVPNAESIPKADATIPAVMAASIIAKTNRDFAMHAAHEEYPRYGFQSHVGYGTREHLAALRSYGPCALHRTSYRPIREIIHDRQRVVGARSEG